MQGVLNLKAKPGEGMEFLAHIRDLRCAASARADAVSQLAT
jgi:hypothetical protein